MALRASFGETNETTPVPFGRPSGVVCTSARTMSPSCAILSQLTSWRNSAFALPRLETNGIAKRSAASGYLGILTSLPEQVLQVLPTNGVWELIFVSAFPSNWIEKYLRWKQRVECQGHLQHHQQEHRNRHHRSHHEEARRIRHVHLREVR